MASIEVPPQFGFVLLTLFSGIFIHHFWMAFKVVGARKKFGVKYPALYADKATCKDADHFNCVQRAHQNSLENFPQFLVLVLTAGLRFPITASIAGLVYLVSRIVYFSGYATGVPDARLRGSFGYIALITLYGCLITWSVQLLRNMA